MVGPAFYKKIRMLVLVALCCSMVALVVPLVFSDLTANLLEKGPAVLLFGCEAGEVRVEE
eukprot:SAG11_NODE_1605_length_4593_cov_2.083667_1_plen_59_part_10